MGAQAVNIDAKYLSVVIASCLCAACLSSVGTGVVAASESEASLMLQVLVRRMSDNMIVLPDGLHLPLAAARDRSTIRIAVLRRVPEYNASVISKAVLLLQGEACANSSSIVGRIKALSQQMEGHKYGWKNDAIFVDGIMGPFTIYGSIPMPNDVDMYIAPYPPVVDIHNGHGVMVFLWGPSPHGAMAVAVFTKIANDWRLEQLGTCNFL
jgi:hypothetical protein